MEVFCLILKSLWSMYDTMTLCLFIWSYLTPIEYVYVLSDQNDQWEKMTCPKWLLQSIMVIGYFQKSVTIRDSDKYASEKSVRGCDGRTYWQCPPTSNCCRKQCQESKYEAGSRNRTRQCALGPILRPHLYLWCPWSNFNMWHHFLHLQNLRNLNLRSLFSTPSLLNPPSLLSTLSQL